jgi:hypothetical protein
LISSGCEVSIVRHADLIISESIFATIGSIKNANLLNKLALLGQGLKKSPIGQKLDFANHSYLCKGLYVNISLYLS